MPSSPNPQPSQYSNIVNAMSVDVEDYFQVNAFKNVVDRASWDYFPLRVEHNTRVALDLFDDHGVKSTFFTLGWIAEREPALVREIADRGHEVACHGYEHKLIFDQTPGEFREDVSRAKKTLEDICGHQVMGYRAPTYSITERSLWALDILIEEGFAYDSSIFPIAHDVYGMPSSPRFPHVIERKAGLIREYPMSTYRAKLPTGELNLPVAGGGYLRLFPVNWLARCLRRINEVEGEPFVIYFHPWEVDPNQPRIKAGLRSTFRHYVNLSRTRGKIAHLLKKFSFAPIVDVLGLREPGEAA